MIFFFLLSAKLFASDAKLCWKYLIMSRNYTWLPMLVKLIFVGFFPPMQVFLVPQTPVLNPFSRKKTKPEKIICNCSNFCFIFFYTFVTKTMCIPNNFIPYVRVMEVNFILNNVFYIVYKIFDISGIFIYTNTFKFYLLWI